MRAVRSSLSWSVPLLLALLLPTVLAQHGHGHAGHDDMSMAMDMPASKPDPPAERLPSYWAHPEHTSMVLAHIVFSVISWIVVMPVAVMLSIAGSRWKILAQFAFLVVNGAGILTGLVYNTSTPDLYPGNAHHTFGWILTWLATAWAVMGVITLYTDKKRSSAGAQARPLLSSHNVDEYQRLNTESPTEPARWSAESNQQTLYTSSRSNSWNSEQSPEPKSFHDDADEEERASAGLGFMQNTKVDAFLAKNVARFAFGVQAKIFHFVYVLLERLLLVLGFVAILTGMLTYARTGWDHGIFSTLAHLIKGGIFFGYGLLTLGRWMGCFADLGWAWNLKPGEKVAGKGLAWIPSAEFTESFVIALYGASNVFLEHLGKGDNSEWSSTDLEHLAITVMFFGGGCVSASPVIGGEKGGS